jgi:hypothetical protein
MWQRRNKGETSASSAAERETRHGKSAPWFLRTLKRGPAVKQVYLVFNALEAGLPMSLRGLRCAWYVACVASQFSNPFVLFARTGPVVAK